MTRHVRSLNVPLAYLRAFIIVLVVAQHAGMPYNTIMPEAPAESMTEFAQSMRIVAPVNDEQRSELLSLFTAFNGDPVGRLDPLGLVSDLPVGTAAKNLKDVYKTIGEARKAARELGGQIIKDEGALSFDVTSKGIDLLQKPLGLAVRLSDGDTKQRADDAGQCRR